MTREPACRAARSVSITFSGEALRTAPLYESISDVGTPQGPSGTPPEGAAAEQAARAAPAVAEAAGPAAGAPPRQLRPLRFWASFRNASIALPMAPSRARSSQRQLMKAQG